MTCKSLETQTYIRTFIQVFFRQDEQDEPDCFNLVNQNSYPV